MGLTRFVFLVGTILTTLMGMGIVTELLRRRNIDIRAGVGIIVVVLLGLYVRWLIRTGRSLLPAGRWSRLWSGPSHALGTAAHLTPGPYELVDTLTGKTFTGHLSHRVVDYQLVGSDGELLPSNAIPFSDHADRHLVFSFDSADDARMFMRLKQVPNPAGDRDEKQEKTHHD